MERIYRLWAYFINSLCYLVARNPIVISAWVQIKSGKVQHRNWGDEFNVYLLEKLTGRKVIVANRSLLHFMFPSKRYICIGSVIGWYETEFSEIWGAGAMSDKAVVKNRPAKVHLVRGKHTRELLLRQNIDCPEVYGDPALLLSRVYTPRIAKRYRLGIIPHYADENLRFISEFVAKHDDICLISMSKYDKWTDIIDKICSCEFIVSSSLHGLIVSDSYNVPNLWASFSNDNINGGLFKYRDYFSSVGRNESALPIGIMSLDELDNVYNKVESFKYDRPVIDYEMILNSCPFMGSNT